MIDELTMSHNLLYLTQTCEAGRNGHFCFSTLRCLVELTWRISLICPLDPRNAFIPLILQGLRQSSCRGQGRENREGMGFL